MSLAVQRRSQVLFLPLFMHLPCRYRAPPSARHCARDTRSARLGSGTVGAVDGAVRLQVLLREVKGCWAGSQDVAESPIRAQILLNPFVRELPRRRRTSSSAAWTLLSTTRLLRMHPVPQSVLLCVTSAMTARLGDGARTTTFVKHSRALLEEITEVVWCPAAKALVCKQQQPQQRQQQQQQQPLFNRYVRKE